MNGEIRSERAPAPLGPYSQARAAAGILYVAGQGPLDLEGQVQGETLEDQARATLDNPEGHRGGGRRQLE